MSALAKANSSCRNLSRGSREDPSDAALEALQLLRNLSRRLRACRTDNNDRGPRKRQAIESPNPLFVL